ncbi:cytochrome B6 [Nitrospira sp. MA-1]|nr:cytochrome B6 [Nitrospira sp. MA-1]
MDIYSTVSQVTWRMSRSLIMGCILIASSGLGMGLAADQGKPESWEAVPGSGQLVPQIGPPAVVKDWQRAYPQYQPVGKGDTQESPDAKPGTPNPPAIHTFGGRTPSSFVFDLSPDEPLEKVIEEETQQRSKIKSQQQDLLEERYDLSPQFVEGVTMTRGKPVPKGPTARLKNGLTFAQLARMPEEDIKAEDLFPYLPLPHPLHSTGGMVFPSMMTEIHPERERFDVVHDLPDHFLPEFPPPLFLTSRPDLGDVSQGQEITNENFYALFDGILSPVQFDGVRLLVEKIPQQQFNATDDRKTVPPSRGVACFDCHVNGHTNGAIHLNPDNRPQFSRFRIETPSLRGVNIQKVFGSKRAMTSVEDFSEFENRSAYFDHDLATAEKKGRRDLTRTEVMKMAQFQKLVDFPPAPKLDLFGRLNPKKATEEELRGEALFSGKAKCVACHTAPYFTDNLMHDLKVERFYHGRAEGSIKTFPLRGIKDSPPYLHDGRLLTLEDTVEFFALVTGVQLTKEEKADLSAYLRTL